MRHAEAAMTERQAESRYGCGICLERDGKDNWFPSAWDVEQHIKDDHFGRKAPK